MDVDAFLRFLFPTVNPDDPDEAVVIAGDEKENTSWEARRWRPGETAEPLGRLYFGISTVAMNRRQRRALNRVALLRRTWVIGLDDIGTKFPEPKLPPTLILETSPGNTQWFYRLSYPADPGRAAALIDGIAAAGMTDPGADRANRYLRVPGSLNVKRAEPFRARVVAFHPERLWTLAELEIALGVVAAEPRGSLEAPPTLGDNQVDPVLEWLLAHDLVLGDPKRGWVPIACPWQDEHTPGPEAAKGTDYHPGAPGGFKCLHGHCAGRTTRDLKEWILEQDPEVSLEQLDVLAGLDLVGIGSDIAAAIESVRCSPDTLEQRAGHSPEAVRFRAQRQATASSGSPALRLEQHIRPIELGAGMLSRPALTAIGNISLKQPISDANVHAVMEMIGLDARFNVMTGDYEASLAGYDGAEDVVDMWGVLVKACQCCGMTGGHEAIWHAAERYAISKRYHPVLDWIDDGPGWDGVDRIQALADTLCMQDERLNPWRDIVVRRALIQAMTAMTNWTRAVPADVGYCMVLQGHQGIEKSKWVASLLPPGWVTSDAKLNLDFGERDSWRKATMTPITELGELESTFKKSDVSALKNFLTTKVDIYRMPYGRHTLKHPRGTVFIPTLNPRMFLADPTGERRFWTLAVRKCLRHDIDLQQLWVQAALLQEDGEQYWLTPEEEKMHHEVSQEHQVDSDAFMIVSDLDYRRQGGTRDDTWLHASAEELLVAYNKVVRQVAKIELGSLLDRTDWAQFTKIRGKRGYWVPSWRIPVTAAQKGELSVVRSILPKKLGKD